MECPSESTNKSLHFAVSEMEAHSGEDICPRSHSPLTSKIFDWYLLHSFLEVRHSTERPQWVAHVADRETEIQKSKKACYRATSTCLSALSNGRPGLTRGFLQLRVLHVIFCLILTALSLLFQTREGEMEAQRGNDSPETTCTCPYNFRGQGFAIRRDLKEVWGSPGWEAMVVAPLPPHPSLPHGIL